MDKKAVLIRMPEGLHFGLAKIAADKGISFNSLVCGALFDFWDHEGVRRSKRAAWSAASVALVSSKGNNLDAAQKEGVFVEPVGGRNARCTCGSGKKWKVCHGRS